MLKGAEGGRPLIIFRDRAGGAKNVSAIGRCDEQFLNMNGFLNPFKTFPPKQAQSLSCSDAVMRTPIFFSVVNDRVSRRKKYGGSHNELGARKRLRRYCSDAQKYPPRHYFESIFAETGAKTGTPAISAVN